MVYDNLNNIKLFHWNANGITNSSHARQLEYLLERENILIASLNETHLNETHKLFFKNYFIYRNDRQNSRGGGVALIVRRSVKHKLLPISTTQKIENLSIEILINNRPFIISTAYSPRYAPSFANDILNLMQFNKEFIILGDFNARHYAWNCNSSNTAGDVLYDLQQNHNFFVYYPNSPTYYPYQRNRNTSVIDIVLSNSTQHLNIDVLGFEIPSDHRPILCSIAQSSTNLFDPSYYNYKLTNWTSFRNFIENRISLRTDIYSTKDAIDLEIEKFIKLTSEARDLSTPKVSYSSNSNLPKDIVTLIRARRTFKRKSQRTPIIHQSNFYEQCVKLLNIMINNKIKAERNNKWNMMLSQLKPGDKSFWRISRSLRGKSNKKIPHFNQGNRKINTDEEKAEILADTFATANNITCNYKHSIDKTVNATVTRFKAESIDSEGDDLTTFDEISYLISTLKATKTPGLDNISNILIKNLPIKAIQILVVIFNSCIHLKYFPKHFKTAKVLAIPKPHKSKNEPGNYRPISLLSNVGKLFEKIIQTRICDYATNASIIANEQFGFKKQHSSVHQVNRIRNVITANKQRRYSTGLIILDIEKAFDSIWHNGLIYKLLHANVPKYLCKLIAEFLSNRTFVVSVNDILSSPKTITAGLPQGSILSPLLYSIYTSDFSPPSYLKTAYYADDTALITSSKLTKALLKKMEKGFSACNKYLYKWKIKINPNKTQAIIFPFNNSPKRTPNRQLRFGNESIPIQKYIKYLGVVLDSKLNYGRHIEETCKKSLRTIKALWPIINKRSSLNYKNKNLIFKNVIRPTITYACPIWYKAAKTHLKKLQILQNKCLKIINNKHWRYSTQLLHSDTGYEKIYDFIERLNNKYFENIENSTYPMIRECRESS